jgi:hypothetical protein
MTSIAELNAGDRIRITGILPHDPAPLEIGEEGTVTAIYNPGDFYEQVHVKWDSGRTPMLVPGDPFEVIE